MAKRLKALFFKEFLTKTFFLKKIKKELHPPQWPFVLGILLAALGGYLVTKHVPKPGPVAEAKASPTP